MCVRQREKERERTIKTPNHNIATPGNLNYLILTSVPLRSCKVMVFKRSKSKTLEKLLGLSISVQVAQ